MFKGLIILESLTNPDFVNTLKVSKHETWNVENSAKDQPSVWNVLNIEIQSKDIKEVVQKLSSLLKKGKWYINIDDSKVFYIIFRDKVFKYSEGDSATREAAKAYARGLEIPESQIDW